MRNSPSLGGNMSRRPSKTGTPLLGNILEERDGGSHFSASSSSHTSPKSPSAPYDSTSLSFTANAARRASLLPTTIRRKALRSRSNRRAWLVVFALAITSYTLWSRAGGTSHPVVQRAKSAMEQQPCRYLPFLHRCRRDPFAGLEYKVEDGLLYYPAQLALASGEGSDEPPPQPHPIHLLIKDAEAAWQEKVARQSHTLEDAVGEYQRRYNMAPPLGFDKWWEFATENNVQFLDEYDSIYEKILPFHSLPRDVLQHRSWMLQHDDKLWLKDLAFTIEISADKGGKVDSRGPMLHRNNRAEQIAALLDGISQHVPVNLNLTITGHDVPWIVPAGEAMENHRKAALAGKYIQEEDYINFMDNHTYDGWTVICPPGSKIRDVGWLDNRMDSWAPPEHPSFIKDHPAAMDVCQHPENQPIHGFTSWPGPRPSLLFPLFAFTVSSMHADLLIPPLEQYEAVVGPDPEWKDKTMNKIVWRGSTTGFDPTFPHMRKWSQRPRLCRIHRQTGTVTVQLALQDTPHAPGPATSYTEHATDLADHYFDFMFNGLPQQCGDEKACADFEREFEWDGFMHVEKQNEYKYVLDIDGNGWSGRFHRLMASNTLVLKSTVFPEWYKDRIQPWVHYVPVRVDYTDLWGIMAFFKGDLDGNGSHDHLAEKIASEGKKWTLENWRWEDMQAYFLRLILEYARVMNKDPDNPTNMDFVLPLPPSQA